MNPMALTNTLFWIWPPSCFWLKVSISNPFEFTLSFCWNLRSQSDLWKYEWQHIIPLFKTIREFLIVLRVKCNLFLLVYGIFLNQVTSMFPTLSHVPLPLAYSPCSNHIGCLSFLEHFKFPFLKQFFHKIPPFHGPWPPHSLSHHVHFLHSTWHNLYLFY